MGDTIIDTNDAIWSFVGSYRIAFGEQWDMDPNYMAMIQLMLLGATLWSMKQLVKLTETEKDDQVLNLFNSLGKVIIAGLPLVAAVLWALAKVFGLAGAVTCSAMKGSVGSALGTILLFGLILGLKQAGFKFGEAFAAIGRFFGNKDENGNKFEPSSVWGFFLAIAIALVINSENFSNAGNNYWPSWIFVAIPAVVMSLYVWQRYQKRGSIRCLRHVPFYGKDGEPHTDSKGNVSTRICGGRIARDEEGNYTAVCTKCKSPGKDICGRHGCKSDYEHKHRHCPSTSCKTLLITWPENMQSLVGTRFTIDGKPIGQAKAAPHTPAAPAPKATKQPAAQPQVAPPASPGPQPRSNAPRRPSRQRKEPWDR